MFIDNALFDEVTNELVYDNNLHYLAYCSVNDIGWQFVGSAALPILKMGVTNDFSLRSRSILLSKLYVGSPTMDL
jgi:hypothetical protein